MSLLDEQLRSRSSLIDRLFATGEGAPGVEEKCHLAEMIRAGSPQENRRLDRILFGKLGQLTQGLNEARANLNELKQILDKLTNPPWHLGIFVQVVDTPEGPRAMVYHGGARRVVNLAEGLELDSLEVGDEVLLSDQLSVLIGKSPDGLPQVGETTEFHRYTDDGRLILRCRDEEFVVQAAAALRGVELTGGDLVRWDRSTWLAYEPIERAAGRRFLLDEVPDARPEQVGGQRANLRSLLAALTTTLVDAEKAKRYALDGRQSILMVGPPGCGKTLMARVAAAEITRRSGKDCRFAAVKPAEWEDPYVGVTQQNIRNCFKTLKEVAEESFAVLFLDEIEAVGRMRGSLVGHHSDKFLAALLAELDGFADRSGVAIIAATNRKDLADPALLERISDVEIVVDRPDARAAREIFRIHLPESTPYSPNGELAGQTREELVDRAVSRLYDPNAENELCKIKFRDGKSRTVTARELISGRSIEQICRAARQSAYLRDVHSGAPGVRAEDIDEAVSDAIQRLSTTLSRYNAHAYLCDLPQDLDVVAVEPITRQVKRSYRYLNVT